MNKLWYYILTPIISSLVIAGVIYFYSLIYDMFKMKRLKKKIPTNAKDLADPGKPLEIDRKGVEEDERRRFSKFREFEKLRYLEERERSTQDAVRPYSRTIRESERWEVENKASDRDTRLEHDTEDAGRELEESGEPTVLTESDEHKFKHEPVDKSSSRSSEEFRFY